MIRTPWLTPPEPGSPEIHRPPGISQDPGGPALTGLGGASGERFPSRVEVIADFCAESRLRFRPENVHVFPLSGSGRGRRRPLEFRQFRPVTPRLLSTGGVLAVAGAGRRSEGPDPGEDGQEDTGLPPDRMSLTRPRCSPGERSKPRPGWGRPHSRNPWPPGAGPIRPAFRPAKRKLRRRRNPPAARENCRGSRSSLPDGPAKAPQNLLSSAARQMSWPSWSDRRYSRDACRSTAGSPDRPALRRHTGDGHDHPSQGTVDHPDIQVASLSAFARSPEGRP